MNKKLTLYNIKNSWKTVLEKFKEKRLIIIYASILTGTLTDYNSHDNILTISYSPYYRFNLDRLSKADYYTEINEVLVEVFDTEIKVLFKILECNFEIVEDANIETFIYNNLTKKLTLDIIKNSWKTVLEKFKEKRLMIIYASILTGTLTDYNSDDNILTISYSPYYRFNLDRLSKADYYTEINEVLAEVFDTEIKVLFKILEDDNYINENLIIPLKLHNDTKSLEIIDTISPITTFTYNTIAELYLYTLKELNSMPYDEYLKTEHWKHFRKEAVIHYNSKCALCNKTRNLNVHHKDYTNRGRETFNDVILLCKQCHNGHHKFKS